MKMRYIFLPVVLAVIAVGACVFGSEKTPDEKASDELNRGLEAHSAGLLDEAAGAYQKVLTYDSQNKFAFYNLGVIEQTLERPGPAENYYRLVLTVDSDFVPALFNLAILRKSAGSTQEAIELYRNVVTIQLNHAGAHLNLGLALLEIGEESESEEHLARAIELDPSLQARIPAPLASPAPSLTPAEEP